jgi:hypothetical protein
MVAELGGEGKITEEQRMLVNTAVSTELLRDNVLVRLLDQTIQGTERRACEREHRRLDDALTRTLKMLAKSRSRARLGHRRSKHLPAQASP